MPTPIPSWVPITNPVVDGQQVNALVTNRQPNQIQQRTDYLKAILDSIQAGEALYARNVNLEAGALAGHAVYWDVATLEYKRALAAASFNNAIAGYTILPSSYVVGIVTYKYTATTGDILLTGRLRNFDFTNGAGVTGDLPADAGPYFLSSSIPGHYTKQQPPIAVYVGVLQGDGSAILSPTPKDLLDAHVHYVVDLFAKPAGTLACDTPDRPYEFVDVDPESPGWLPADDATFLGLAPVGAKFGYNIAQHPDLEKIFPPVPFGNAYIERNGLGVDQSKYIINNQTIWWMDDCYGNAPFPIEPRPCDVSSSSLSSESSPSSSSSLAGICPSGPPLALAGFQYNDPFHCTMKLYFTKMVFKNSNNVVTSLRAAVGSPITVTGCDSTSPASTGDLCLDLNLALLIEDGQVGYKALKDIVGSTFKRGPMVEAIKAGPNIVITPVLGESETDVSGFVYGKMTIQAANPGGLFSEGLASLVTLNGAQESQLNGVFFLTLPSARPTSFTGRIVLPVAGAITLPQMQLVFWVLGRATGVLPGLHLSYKRIIRPAGCSAIVLPSSNTSLSDLGSCTLSAANSYVELASDPFTVTDGDEVIFTVSRDGYPTDSYNADLGLLKIGYQLTPS